MGRKNTLDRQFPIIVFIMIIIIVVNGCFFSTEFHHMIDVREQLQEDMHEEMWRTIKKELTYKYSILTGDAKFLSKKIEASILRNYGSELDKLKDDFDNDKLDRELYNLFKDEILNDYYNFNSSTNEKHFTYAIGLKTHILAIFTNDGTDNMATGTTWQEYFNNSANIKLNESLVFNIVNKNLTDNILLYQTEPIDDNSNINMKHSLESLKNLYDKFGINILKKFDFVNVSYITEYGDIFGTDDYIYMEDTSNHKMIIVKTTNVYDSIIGDVKYEIASIETKYNNSISEISNSIMRLSLGFISITASLFILVIFSSVIYNRNLNR